MTLDLPKPVAAYFAANKRDNEAIAKCFTENAIVNDEGHTGTGLNEIKGREAETSTKYV
jgi:hypothetical protein